MKEERRYIFRSSVIRTHKFQVQHFIMTFHLEFQEFASVQQTEQSMIIKLIRSLQILAHVIVVLNSHSFH